MGTLVPPASLTPRCSFSRFARPGHCPCFARFGPQGRRASDSGALPAGGAAGAAEERARAYRPCVSAPKGLTASSRRGAEDDGR